MNLSFKYGHIKRSQECPEISLTYRSDNHVSLKIGLKADAQIVSKLIITVHVF